jgi:hypothetical protein
MRSRPALLAAFVSLSLLRTGALAAQPAEAPGPTRTFQVILLTASNQGETSLQNLAPGAQKALQDVRQFLPYKSYVFTDMAWLRSSARAQAHLKGPGAKEYNLGFTFHEDGGKKLFIDSFDLNDPSAQPPLVAGQTPRAMPNLISTSFGLQVGETVVVGVSRVGGGDQALIVLLTAIP